MSTKNEIPFPLGSPSASSWLASLEEYPCKRCGKMSIFKDLCSDCDTLLSRREESNDLRQEIRSINDEIKELEARKNKLLKEESEVNRWLFKHDKGDK